MRINSNKRTFHEFVLISKEEAQALLDEADGDQAIFNRHRRRSIVNAYRDAMNTGKWDPERRNDPIQLSGPNPNNPGKLFAGQHRCQALVESSLKECWFYVLFNATEKDRIYQDTNANRSLADRVAIQEGARIDGLEVMHKQTASAAFRLLYNLETWDGSILYPRDTADPTRIAELTREHKESLHMLDATLTEYKSVSSDARVLAKMAPIVAGFLLTRRGFRDTDHWLSAWRNVMDPEATRDSTVEATFRKWFPSQEGELRHMAKRWGALGITLVFLRAKKEGKYLPILNEDSCIFDYWTGRRLHRSAA